MTPQGSVPVNPDLLEKYAVIRSSPRWTEVEESRKRLEKLRESKQPYDKMEVDRDNVLRYAATLQRASETVTAGLCLAVHLAGFSAATRPDQRIEDGLRALSSGLDLPALDETDTKAELARCLAAAFPELRIEQPAMNDLGAWQASLEKALAFVRGAPPVDLPGCQKRAREAWKARLLAHLARQTEIPPDIDYLRCRTAGYPEGQVLRGRHLTVREWSEGYIAGISASPAILPLWFAFGALGGLGFEVGKELASAGSRASYDESQEAGEFVQRAAPMAPRKGIIVVRVGTESVTTNWRVGAVPALVVTAEQYLGEAKVDLKNYFQSRLHGILIEVERAESWEAGLRRVDVSRISRSVAVPLGFIVSRPPETMPAGYRFAVSPPDAATACNEVFLSTPPPA